MEKVLGNKRSIFLFILPGLTLFLVFVIYPLCNVFYLSFQKYDSMTPAEFIGLDNFTRIFQDSSFWNALLRSLMLCGVTIFIDSVVALAFVLIVMTLNKRLQKFCKTAFLLPFVLSIAVISQLWLAMFHPDWGLINMLLELTGLEFLQRAWLLESSTAMLSVGFVGIWHIFGMQFLLLYTGYRSIPDMYFEAAEMDGANFFHRTIHVTLPLLNNIIRISLTMTAIGGFYTFPQVYIMTGGGPGQTTETIMMFMYKQVFTNTRFGLGASVAVVAILIGLCLFVQQA